VCYRLVAMVESVSQNNDCLMAHTSTISMTVHWMYAAENLSYTFCACFNDVDGLCALQFSFAALQGPPSPQHGAPLTHL
jgi:hypothetical protein